MKRVVFEWVERVVDYSTEREAKDDIRKILRTRGAGRARIVEEYPNDHAFNGKGGYTVVYMTDAGRGKECGW